MQEAKFTTTPNLAFFLRYKEYSHPDLDVWYIFFFFFFYKDISLVSVYKRAGELLEKFPQPCLQLNTWYGFYLLHRRSHCISLWIVLLLKCFQSTDGDRLPMRNPCHVNSQSHPQDRADKCALRLCVWARHPQYWKGKPTSKQNIRFLTIASSLDTASTTIHCRREVCERFCGLLGVTASMPSTILTHKNRKVIPMHFLYVMVVECCYPNVHPSSMVLCLKLQPFDVNFQP